MENISLVKRISPALSQSVHFLSPELKGITEKSVDVLF